MSTNHTEIKILPATAIGIGTILFFITIVVSPYINFPVFSNADAVTKLLIISGASLLGIFQLLFFVPRISKNTFKAIPRSVSVAIKVSLISLTLTILLSSSIKTSLFGMFTTWENNAMTFLIYVILGVSWLIYFLILKENNLHKSVFHTLLTISVVVAVIYSIGEYYFWHSTTGYLSSGVTRISLGFRNPLFAAFFLGMNWSYVAARFLTTITEQTKKFQSFGYFILTIGATLALTLTFTRSAWISAAISFVFICIGIFIKTFKSVNEKADKSNSLLRYLIAIGLLVITVLTIFYNYRKEISSRNSDIAIESKTTLATISQTLGKENSPESALDFYQKNGDYSSSRIRLEEWKWGLRTWTGSVKNLLLGIGPDAGFFGMPKYRDPIFNDFTTDSATKPFYVRSLYINSLMQFGVVFILSTLIIILYVVRLLFRYSDLAGLAIIVGFFAQGIFYYPSFIPTTILVFTLAFLFSELFENDTINHRKPNNGERIILILLLILISFWSVTIAKVSYITSTYQQTVLPFSQEIMEKNARILVNNNVLKRYFVYHYSETPTSVAYLSELSKSNDVDDLRIAADAYYLRARNANTNEEAFLSISALRKLLTIDKTLPSTWDSIGLRYLYIKDFSHASESFLQAIALKPDYWYSYLHMGELLRQQCKPNEAINWYKKANQYVPSTATEISEAKQEIANPRAECK